MKNIILLAILMFAITEAFAMPTLNWQSPSNTGLGNEGQEPETPDTESQIDTDGGDEVVDTIDTEPSIQEENEGKRENGTANRVK